ncbi:hypothetical protein IT408_03950 [Candidatus Uhrbacteria bacterium]|nr:hypothetical protein [Candidatus Uhrbacteria bacterium]
MTKKINPVVVVFITVLVVFGVVTTSYLTQKRVQKPIENSPTVTDNTSTELIPSLVLTNESAVLLVHANGLMERITYPQFLSKNPDSSTWPSRGIDVATGQEKPFEIRGVDVEVPEGLLSPDRVFRAVLKESKPDGAGVIELLRPKQAGRDIVLRIGDKPLKDVQLLGWFNSEELAVIALNASARAVYSVHLDGKISSLGDLPDSVLYLNLSHGKLYVTTAVQDKGIENAPHGPSEVYVFHAETQGSVFTSDSVINAFVSNQSKLDSDEFVYVNDLGVAILVEKGKPTTLGKIRPLLFTESSDLIYRDGFDLMLRKKQDGKVVRIGAIPEGAVNLYYVSK